jgi:hypothetical protein
MYFRLADTTLAVRNTPPLPVRFVIGHAKPTPVRSGAIPKRLTGTKENWRRGHGEWEAANLLNKAKASEIIRSPLRLSFNHAPEGARSKGLTAPSKWDSYPPSVWMGISLVTAALTSQGEAVVLKGATQLAGSEGAESAVINVTIG